MNTHRNIQNVAIVLGAAVAGGLLFAVAFQSHPDITAKTDRLSGSSVETAFLPERFGVPGAN